MGPSIFLVLSLATSGCQDPPPNVVGGDARPAVVPDTAQPSAIVLLHEDGVENAYPRLSADGTRILYQSNRTGT